MASSASPKKQRSKPPRGRPAATSLLSQPVVQDASSLTAFSSFSPNGSLFAFLSLAVDKHRLRVYDTVSGQSVAEHVVDSARVTALTWNQSNTSEWQDSVADESLHPSKKKKRRKSRTTAEAENVQGSGREVVVLGLADGTVLFFSPTHGRIVRTLSHSKSTSAILSLAATENTSSASTSIWTSCADGTIRLWDARRNEIAGSWKGDDRIPYTSMAIRPSMRNGDGVDILVANHSIRLLSTTSSPSEAMGVENKKPAALASFTGHASSVTHLQWDASQTPPNRFLSTAEGDRFVYIWEVPDAQSGSSTEGRIIASIPLDSDARHISMPSNMPSLLSLSASGKICIFPIPAELTPPAGSEKSRHKVPTLLSRSNITITAKKNSSPVQVVNASFSEEGRICVVRLVGGVRPVFDVVQYLDDSGDFIQEVNVVSDDAVGLTGESLSSGVVPNKRYAERSSLAIRSGVEIGQDEAMDDLVLQDIDGALDVDLAELSLGQRLTALNGAMDQTSTSDGEDGDTPKESSKHRRRHDASSVVPANSLTRTLIQALHSSDSRLLETCLAHSDTALIRNTVRRLPPQLAIPLLLACVERLGRGARAANMKGGGGGASSQRGTGLIAWVKTVLAIHSGHLMTMPDLVARLSGLHATLTTRLTLQDSLLSLSGRLDMVLSQIEMRSSAAPAPLVPPKGKQPSGSQKKHEARRYVEGESEDEAQMEVEVEMESGDDAGSIEDVELGGDSQDEDEAEDSEGSEDEDEDEDEDENSEDGEGPTLNGFIDDEAEEFDEDEDDASE